MNGEVILSQARERLGELVRGRPGPNPVPAPFEVSPWVALSLLQKGIRRGRVDLAWRAAATLLRDAPDRLWRRLATVAAEDVGLGDMETLSLATAAVSGKLFRKTLGGEWPVAVAIVERLALSTKCRASDDLTMVVQHHPSLFEAKQIMADMIPSELIRVAAGESPLPERGLATWLAIGTHRYRSEHLPQMRGDPHGVFDAFCDNGYPQTVVEVCREGLRKTGHVICPFVSLMSPLPGRNGAVTKPDDLPTERYVRGVPTWTFDMFVREGRKAMTLFLAEGSETANWIRRHVSPRDRIGFFGNILFAVEGGLLSCRMDWPTGRSLRHLAEIQSQGPHCEDASEIIGLLQNDLHLLDGVRADVC